MGDVGVPVGSPAPSDGALAGRRQSLWKVESRPSPPPPSPGSADHEPLRPRDCWTLACCLPGALSTRARPLALESQPRAFAAGSRALRALAPPFPTGSRAARRGREHSERVRTGPPTGAQVLGWVRVAPGPRLRALGGAKREECGERGAGRIPGARGRTGRQEVPCDGNHSGANAPVGAGALDLGPSYPRTEGALLPPPPSPAGRGPSRAASSRAPAAPVPTR